MPFVRTVSVWDESPTRRVLRLVERRATDGLGDYAWPLEVELIQAPPWGYSRHLKMLFDFIDQPLGQERTLQEFPLERGRNTK